QTLGVIGSAALRDQVFDTIVSKRLAGIDRIVPVGTTSHFSFTWDGKDLIRAMSRSFERMAA
ncbi:MAG: hypothetical protein AAF337_03570, partial [Pseudomonadota bacterium]